MSLSYRCCLSHTACCLLISLLLIFQRPVPSCPLELRIRSSIPIAIHTALFQHQTEVDVGLLLFLLLLRLMFLLLLLLLLLFLLPLTCLLFLYLFFHFAAQRVG